MAPLTHTEIQQAKPQAKQIKLFDEKGLYLIITPAGGKLWRFDYRHDGKRKTLALGKFPEVNLKQARAARDEARGVCANGADPAELRKSAKAERKQQAEAQAEAEHIAALIASGEALPGSFEAVAREWFARYEPSWAKSNAHKLISRLERDIFPYIGRTPIGEVTARAMLEVLRRIEARGANETAHRARQNLGQIMRYAVAIGQATHDPAAALRGALAPVIKGHFASVTEPAKIGELLRMLAGYHGSPVTRAALALAPLVFVRPGELRHMQWADIDLLEAEWRYTTSKTGQCHIVPLARQAVEILQDLHPLTGGQQYVFISARDPKRPMSDNAILAAMRRMGIGTDEMTGHGFRAMARTVLDEIHGFRPDIIELQLAHAVRDPLGRAYNRTTHLEERRRMMQVWADYLDTLRTSGTVIHAKFSRAQG